MTRRTFLSYIAGGIASLAVSACGPAPTATPTATPTRPRASATATATSAPTQPPATATPVPPNTPTRPPATAAPTAAATATKAPPSPTLAPPTATAAPTANPGSTRMTSPDYGIHVFLGYSKEATARDLSLAKNAGFTWVKQRMEWNALAPDEQGQMKTDVLATYDDIVNAVAASGLKLIVRVGQPPAWAASLKKTIVPDTKEPPADPPPDDLSPTGPLANFLYGLASRYRGKVAAWQIWNEPNLRREWGKTPDAAEYTRLLKTAYHALKAADPNTIIISAGMSPTGAPPPEAVPDDTYLDQMYQAFAGRSSSGYCDVVGAHGAGYKAPPEMDPAQVAADKTYGGHRSFCFRRIEDLRAIMVKYGDGNKQMALLEFGWVIDGGAALDPSYRWHAVSADVQADYIVRAFKWARDKWSPWMGVMSLIYILAPGFRRDSEYYWWAITDPDGTPRPAYNRIKTFRQTGN